MPENSKTAVEELVKSLIADSFPSLRDIRLVVALTESPDAIAEMEFSAKDRSAKLWVDRTDLSRMSRDALVGTLVHELCHVEADARRGLLGRWLYDPLYWRFPRVLSWEERRVDREVLRKGYGHHLLALSKYHNSHYAKYEYSDGLTEAELEAEVNKDKNRA